MDTIVEDEMLVAQFQAGRQDAFDELMRRYKHKINAYLLRSIRNHEDAEELTIEVFFKAYRALNSWQAQARFSTWLYKIAHNLSIDHHRAKSRKPVYYLDDEKINIQDAVATDLASNPASQIEETDRSRLIRAAVNRLSPNQKAVFLLTRYEGLQIKETAEVLGVAEGTVKIHLHRAMKKLEILLRPLWKENEI